MPRRYDIEPSALEPGEYLKGTIVEKRGDGEVEFFAWWVCTPNGLLGRLCMPEDVVRGRHPGSHRVIEHEDGTISVPPPAPSEGPNSIKVTGWPLRGRPGSPRQPGEPLMEWHGYIVNDQWVPC